jgi:hypothetical protein
MNASSKARPRTHESPRSGSAERRLKELGIKLPAPPEPFGTYVEAVQTGNLLFLSGLLPTEGQGAKFIGRIGEPAEDARFVAVFAHSLEHTGGYTPEEATRVAGTLLPDILCYDPRRPAAYPDNGGNSPTTLWMASFPSSPMER